MVKLVQKGVLKIRGTIFLVVWTFQGRVPRHTCTSAFFFVMPDSRAQFATGKSCITQALEAAPLFFTIWV